MAYEQKTPDKKDSLKDYIEVNERVQEFWVKHPNGRIATEIVSWNDGVVIMRASVYKDLSDTLPSAIGHAYEKENSTFINKTSALENCETSCVGRALGLLGLSIKRSIASKEEVANAISQQQEQPKAKQVKDNDVANKAKYNLLNGSPNGYDDFLQKMKAKGYDADQVTEYLTKKVEERKNNKEVKENE